MSAGATGAGEGKAVGVGCASPRNGSGFADAERRLVLPWQHQHVDLGQVREFYDRISAPFAGRHRAAFERDFLHQRAAGGLNDIAVDLVPYAVRIDHQPGILPGDDAGHADVAGCLVDGDVGNPGRPRGAVAGKLAVNVQCIGKTAAADDIALGFRFPPYRARLPAGAFGDRVDEIDRALVFQVAQAVLDRIDAGLRREFVDIGFMRERIGQRRDATKPGGAHDRRHVVRHHAHILVVVRRDRGAVAHLEYDMLRGNPPREQQRQGRRAVGGIACGKVVSSNTAIGVESTIDVHQLGGALRLPGVLLLARQLHADRTADRARQQQRIRSDVIGAVAAIAAGGFHPNDVDVRFRPFD